MGGRSILHRANRAYFTRRTARVARQGIRTVLSWGFQRPCHQPAAVLVRSSAGRGRGEERAPRWATTQPRQVCTALRMLRGRSTAGSREESRAHRAPRESKAMITGALSSCLRPIAVLVRSSPGRRRGKERAPRWPTTQPRQVRTARHASSEDGRPIFHEAKSARAARHIIRSE